MKLYNQILFFACCVKGWSAGNQQPEPAFLYDWQKPNRRDWTTIYPGVYTIVSEWGNKATGGFHSG